MHVSLTSYWPMLASQSGNFQCVGELFLQRAISEGQLHNVHKYVVTPGLSWPWTWVTDNWGQGSPKPAWDVQGMVKCIWMICAAPRELSKKAGTAKEAVRGNRLSLPSQKHWDSLLYYSHIVDKNQSRSTNALKEKSSGNLFYLCEQKQTSLITYQPSGHQL